MLYPLSYGGKPFWRQDLRHTHQVCNLPFTPAATPVIINRNGQAVRTPGRKTRRAVGMHAMPSRHSTGAAAPSKPKKPYPAFPLYAHAAGCWAKKIRGETHYFGPWSDPEGALQLYLREKYALHAGLPPPEASDELTIVHLCGRFLTAKKRRQEQGRMTLRSYRDYVDTAQHLADGLGRRTTVAGLRPLDFERLQAAWAKLWGPVRLRNQITRARSIFTYAFRNDLIAKPVNFGDSFTAPSLAELRRHKQRQARELGPRLFTPTELRAMLAAAGPALRAMILLGVNCGFGNADVGTLPLAAVDLDRGWVDFPRPKTAVERH